MNKIGTVKDKNILFLQGPMGKFFKKLDLTFRQHGAKTYKIGLNGGDWFFSNSDNYIPFKDRKETWETYIKDFLNTHKIDKVFLFGDCRYYQSKAIKMALELDIEIFVFEEGYVRPHYITMERFGVNDYSHISRDPNFYNNLLEINQNTTIHAHQSKFKMIMSAVTYYLIANVLHHKYPHYEHHRDFSAIKEGFYGLRGVFRKLIYPFYESKYLKKIEGELSKKYFFVPLQTHNDFQILQHSQYGSIEKFIIEILESFSKQEDENIWLVFKHHPVDRGRKNYNDFIMNQAELLKIEKRIIVLHDIHLPTCLQQAKGTITINSTVGLSSIGHNIPTLTLGNAIYDIEGLTCKGMSLEEFWKAPKTPDEILYQKFRKYLIDITQLNGSFYGRFPVEFETDEMYS